jgi:hypothetical protein
VLPTMQFRAGRRAVYGHGRKFADRNRVGFVAHGTVTNQAVTVRAVRLDRKRHAKS